MATEFKYDRNIHKKCETKMITIFLQDGVDDLIYCPKCNSPKGIKEWTKKYNYKVHKLDYDYKNSNYHSTAKDNKTEEVLITNY